MVQVALLRGVNLALDGRLVQPAYGRVVKRYFAQQLLSAHRSRRPTYPADMYDALHTLAQTWIRQIETTGYPVHGDLQELMPLAPATAVPNSV